MPGELLFGVRLILLFDEITLPKRVQMFMNHHQILDYRRFAATQTNDFLNEQCLLIKKYAKNQWVTTNYIPNYDEGHIGGSSCVGFPKLYPLHGIWR